MSVKLSEFCKKCGKEVVYEKERLCWACGQNEWGCQRWEFNEDGSAKKRIKSIDNQRIKFI